MEQDSAGEEEPAYMRQDEHLGGACSPAVHADTQQEGPSQLSATPSNPSVESSHMHHFESVETMSSSVSEHITNTSLDELDTRRLWLAAFLAEQLQHRQLPPLTMPRPPVKRRQGIRPLTQADLTKLDAASKAKLNTQPEWQQQLLRLRKFMRATQKFGANVHSGVDGNGFYAAQHLKSVLAQQGTEADVTNPQTPAEKRLHQAWRRGRGLYSTSMRHHIDQYTVHEDEEDGNELWEVEKEEDAGVAAGRVLIMEMLDQWQAAIVIQRAFRSFKRRCEGHGWPSQSAERRAAARRRMKSFDWGTDTVFRTLLLGRKFIEAQEQNQRDWERQHGREPAGPTPLDKAREAARALIEAGRHMRDHGVKLPPQDSSGEAMLEHMLFSGGLDLLGELSRATSDDQVQRIIQRRTAIMLAAKSAEAEAAAAAAADMGSSDWDEAPAGEDSEVAPRSHPFLARVATMVREAANGVKRGGFSVTAALLRNRRLDTIAALQASVGSATSSKHSGKGGGLRGAQASGVPDLPQQPAGKAIRGLRGTAARPLARKPTWHHGGATLAPGVQGRGTKGSKAGGRGQGAGLSRAGRWAAEQGAEGGPGAFDEDAGTSSSTAQPSLPPRQYARLHTRLITWHQELQATHDQGASGELALGPEATEGSLFSGPTFTSVGSDWDTDLDGTGLSDGESEGADKLRRAWTLRGLQAGLAVGRHLLAHQDSQVCSSRGDRDQSVASAVLPFQRRGQSVMVDHRTGTVLGLPGADAQPVLPSEAAGDTQRPGPLATGAVMSTQVAWGASQAGALPQPPGFLPEGGAPLRSGSGRLSAHRLQPLGWVSSGSGAESAGASGVGGATAGIPTLPARSSNSISRGPGGVELPLSGPLRGIEAAAGAQGTELHTAGLPAAGQLEAGRHGSGRQERGLQAAALEELRPPGTRLQALGLAVTVLPGTGLAVTVLPGTVLPGTGLPGTGLPGAGLQGAGLTGPGPQETGLLGLDLRASALQGAGPLGVEPQGMGTQGTGATGMGGQRAGLQLSGSLSLPHSLGQERGEDPLVTQGMSGGEARASGEAADYTSQDLQAHVPVPPASLSRVNSPRQGPRAVRFSEAGDAGQVGRAHGPHQNQNLSPAGSLRLPQDSNGKPGAVEGEPSHLNALDAMQARAAEAAPGGNSAIGLSLQEQEAAGSEGRSAHAPAPDSDSTSASTPPTLLPHLPALAHSSSSKAATSHPAGPLSSPAERTRPSPRPPPLLLGPVSPRPHRGSRSESGGRPDDGHPDGGIAFDGSAAGSGSLGTLEERGGSPGSHSQDLDASRGVTAHHVAPHAGLRPGGVGVGGSTASEHAMCRRSAAPVDTLPDGRTFFPSFIVRVEGSYGLSTVSAEEGSSSLLPHPAAGGPWSGFNSPTTSPSALQPSPHGQGSCHRLRNSNTCWQQHQDEALEASLGDVHGAGVNGRPGVWATSGPNSPNLMGPQRRRYISEPGTQVLLIGDGDAEDVEQGDDLLPCFQLANVRTSAGLVSPRRTKRIPICDPLDPNTKPFTPSPMVAAVAAGFGGGLAPQQRTVSEAGGAFLQELLVLLDKEAGECTLNPTRYRAGSPHRPPPSPGPYGGPPPPRTAPQTPKSPAPGTASLSSTMWTARSKPLTSVRMPPVSGSGGGAGPRSRAVSDCGELMLAADQETAGLLRGTTAPAKKQLLFFMDGSKGLVKVNSPQKLLVAVKPSNMAGEVLVARSQTPEGAGEQLPALSLVPQGWGQRFPASDVHYLPSLVPGAGGSAAGGVSTGSSTAAGGTDVEKQLAQLQRQSQNLLTALAAGPNGARLGPGRGPGVLTPSKRVSTGSGLPI